MKGPGIRNDLDVRRQWQCPACGKVRKTNGDVSVVKCSCTTEGVWMKLQEAQRSRPIIPPPRPVVCEIPAAELDTGDAPPPRRERASSQPAATPAEVVATAQVVTVEVTAVEVTAPEMTATEMTVAAQTTIVEVAVGTDSVSAIEPPAVTAAEAVADDFGSGVAAD